MKKKKTVKINTESQLKKNHITKEVLSFPFYCRTQKANEEKKNTQLLHTKPQEVGLVLIIPDYKYMFFITQLTNKKNIKVHILRYFMYET